MNEKEPASWSEHIGKAEHPVWPTIRYTVGLTAATIILYINASDFDMTEGKSLILIAIVLGGWEVAERLLRNHLPK